MQIPITALTLVIPIVATALLKHVVHIAVHVSLMATAPQHKTVLLDLQTVATCGLPARLIKDLIQSNYSTKHAESPDPNGAGLFCICKRLYRSEKQLCKAPKKPYLSAPFTKWSRSSTDRISVS